VIAERNRALLGVDSTVVHPILQSGEKLIGYDNYITRQFL